MTALQKQPATNVLELSLIGPGYGEAAVLHLGKGIWAIVDSCEDSDGRPRALRYLRDMGVDPSVSVKLIVATHWHDDHIRGMGEQVEMCRSASFCCASVLTKPEFLATIQALEGRHQSEGRSGLRELYTVVKTLRERHATPILASGGRNVLVEDDCHVCALSPSDSTHLDFLRAIYYNYGTAGHKKDRVPVLEPNEISVALWVAVDNTFILLGADLTRKGWTEVLANSIRPRHMASAFKVPHHGAPDAHEPMVWSEMLQNNPCAVLTPWHKGGRSRPAPNDVHRLLSLTSRAYATATSPALRRRSKKRHGLVGRGIADANVGLRSAVAPAGLIRLRTTIGTDDDWSVELFDGACHLGEFLA